MEGRLSRHVLKRLDLAPRGRMALAVVLCVGAWEHIRLVHGTFFEFFVDLDFELSQFLLNSLVDVASFFELTTCERDLISVR